MASWSVSTTTEDEPYTQLVAESFVITVSLVDGEGSSTNKTCDMGRSEKKSNVDSFPQFVDSRHLSFRASHFPMVFVSHPTRLTEHTARGCDLHSCCCFTVVRTYHRKPNRWEATRANDDSRCTVLLFRSMTRMSKNRSTARKEAGPNDQPLHGLQSQQLFLEFSYFLRQASHRLHVNVWRVLPSFGFRICIDEKRETATPLCRTRRVGWVCRRIQVFATKPRALPCDVTKALEDAMTTSVHFPSARTMCMHQHNLPTRLPRVYTAASPTLAIGSLTINTNDVRNAKRGTETSAVLCIPETRVVYEFTDGRVRRSVPLSCYTE